MYHTRVFAGWSSRQVRRGWRRTAGHPQPDGHLHVVAAPRPVGQLLPRRAVL